MTEMTREEALAHFGKKGMKWGVRNERVRSGHGTLGEAHAAAMKSTGHRIANGVLGDKHMWISLAKIAGITAVGSYGALFAPGLIPDHILKDIGAGANRTEGYGPKGEFAFRDTNTGTLKLNNNVETGKALLGLSAGTLGVAAGGAAAVGALGSNAARAVRGNARIRESAEHLGSAVNDRQTSGSRATRKMLQKNGSIPKNSLKQSDLAESGSIKHAEKSGTIQDVYDSASQASKDTIDLCVAAAVEDSDIPDGVDIAADYDKLSAIEQYLIDFIVGNALASTAQHTDLTDVEALMHFGKKGMKWGVRNSPGEGTATIRSKLPTLTTGQKRAVLAISATGAAIAASMMAGPVAGMAISAIGRAGDMALSTSTNTTTTETVNGGDSQTTTSKS